MRLGQTEEMARAEDIAVYLLEGFAAFYTGTTTLLAERCFVMEASRKSGW